MAQYIPKEPLVAEIERIKRELLQRKWQCERKGLEKIMHQISILNKMLSFVNTFEVQEMDLDDFIKEEFNKYSCIDGYGQLSVSYNEAEFYSMIKRLTKAIKGE